MKMLLIIISLFSFISCQEAPNNEDQNSSSSQLLKSSDDFSDLKKEADEACELKEEEVDTTKPFKLQGSDSGCDTNEDQ